MQIEWRGVDEAAAARVAAAVERGLPGIFQGIGGDLDASRADLVFYPALDFVKLRERAAPHRELYAFIDARSGAVVALDFSARPVETLNESGFLQIETADAAVRYAAFYFAAVHGPYGPMPIVDKLDPGQAATPQQEAAAAKLAATHIPPRARAEGEGWRVFAVALLQGALCRCEIVISANGRINLDTHELAVAAD